jgi:head-tail adaptor
MISRKYDKIIELFNLDPISDEFGGFTVVPKSMGKKWAHIETKVSVRNTDNGNVENYQTIMISLRGRGLNLDVKTDYIVYKSKKYVINKIDDVDLTGIDLTAFCTESDG